MLESSINAIKSTIDGRRTPRLQLKQGCRSLLGSETFVTVAQDAHLPCVKAGKSGYLGLPKGQHPLAAITVEGSQECKR